MNQIINSPPIRIGDKITDFLLIVLKETDIYWIRKKSETMKLIPGEIVAIWKIKKIKKEVKL